ncbi:MAG: glutamyl-tRNA reductase [Cellulosilyticaceae bacterium]
MEIAVVGLNHLTAPIQIRERVSFTDSQKIEILNEILDREVKEVVVLSTCNRSEVYIYADQVEAKIEAIKEVYYDFCQVQEVKDFLFAKVGIEAAKYLYQVTAGFHSIVVGEDQILGQVKEAQEFAMEIGASGKVLNKLFREAITTAKQIKTETKISEYPLSISYIGIKFLKEKMGSLEGKSALLIGAGKMNKLALNHLYEQHIGKVYMANRTHQKVYDLTTLHKELIAIDYAKRYEILEEVDILITSTASPHLIIKQADMPNITNELYILDSALPRDVEECVGEDLHIHLYDIDDLKEISHKNSEKRYEIAQQADKIILESLEELIGWMHTIKIDPTIRSLNERCEEIEQDTMNYLKRKIDLSCKEEKIIEKMLRSSLKRLIREPISNLKEIKDKQKQEESIKLLEELFGL